MLNIQRFAAITVVLENQMEVVVPCVFLVLKNLIVVIVQRTELTLVEYAVSAEMTAA